MQTTTPPSPTAEKNESLYIWREKNSPHIRSITAPPSVSRVSTEVTSHFIFTYSDDPNQQSNKIAFPVRVQASAPCLPPAPASLPPFFFLLLFPLKKPHHVQHLRNKSISCFLVFPGWVGCRVTACWSSHTGKHTVLTHELTEVM